jgi:hypothetical protein
MVRIIAGSAIAVSAGWPRWREIGAERDRVLQANEATPALEKKVA